MGPATAPAPASEPPFTVERRPPLAVGIGEQQAAMFSDPRFRDLGIDKARIVVAYDAMSVEFERQLLDVWIAEARRAGVEPFITFGHSRVHPDTLPSVARVPGRVPRVSRRATPTCASTRAWNEINHDGQPTHDHPERAAEYYNVVRRRVPELPRRGRRRARPAGHGAPTCGATAATSTAQPQAWGLHNYTDVNRFRSSGLRAMLQAVSGDIWLTETGGLVQLADRLPRDQQRAARATAFMLKLARADPRVARLYVYNWTGSDPKRAL